MKAAGLPNIKGYMKLTAAEGIGFVSDSYSGALAPTDSYRTLIFDPWGGQTCYHGINFNAANSNAIYGTSSTVQPPALTVRFLIRAKS